MVDHHKKRIRPRMSDEEYAQWQRLQGKEYTIEGVESEWLHSFADGVDEVANAVKVEGKTAVLCDIHLGVHDKQALIAAMNYIRREKVDTIILNGDTIDGAKISRHAKSLHQPKFTQELELAKTFLTGLRSDFSKARILFKLGNHEDRLYDYMMKNADELAGLIDFNRLLNLENLGIELVESTAFIKHPGTYIVHGHEMKISGGVNPARSLLLKAFDNTVMGHVHKSTSSSGKNLSGVFVRTHTIGCLCKLAMGYMPHSNSNHGFGIIEADGKFRNHWIINGVVE